MDAEVLLIPESLERRYSSVMAAAYDFENDEFNNAVVAAGRRAFDEALAAGVPVFYLDDDGLNMKECPAERERQVHYRAFGRF